ncbi:glycerophosphodiester phosphodiesterase [Clostridium scatologenes]|uniref:Glycerophosphoryl diester phosphodiesterase n=1 Tax=Clostridium scatologenes TaxID=1548 RepID=A0A0E3JQA0_CLOSL|nr:glycerophosphodiester phosphodiesterase family protein [Clostridium scatologenes]AKA70754.1 glycerophosphoryl diester phosphodiesterase [Clostridium scatologenes]
MKINYINRKSEILMVTSIIVVFLLSLLAGFKLASQQKSKSSGVYVTDIPVKIIAHRGSSRRAPENTISSILCSVEDKADYAELDVQQTKDGVVVLMHDKSLKRISKLNKNVEETNYKNIEQLSVYANNSKKFRDEKIPKLDEVVKKTKGKIKLDIEIKSYGNDINLPEKVVKIIEDNNVIDSSMVCSFDYRILEKVKKLNPKIQIGYITCSNNDDIFKLKDVDFYSVYNAKVDKELIDKVHKRNKKIHVWTVDNVKDMNKFIEMGVDGIITDYPEKLRAILM